MLITTRTKPCRWSHYVILALFLNQINVNFGSPVFTYNPSIAQFQTGRNIRHLPCVVRRSGIEGICMFAIDCIKANGTHLGTCIDRFYFGSCCQLKDEAALIAPEIVENSIDQNTISHFQPSTIAFYPPPTHRPMHKVSMSPPSPPSSSSSSAYPTTLADSIYNKISTSNGPNRINNYSLISSSSTSSIPKVDSTTQHYTPSITALLNTESKTESSSEQHIIDKLPSLPTTIRNTILTKTPTTTEENIKLQTFQSVQEGTTLSTQTTPAPATRSTTTKKPTNRPISLPSPTQKPTTTKTPAKITVSQSTTSETYITTSSEPITKKPATIPIQTSAKPTVAPIKRPVVTTTKRSNLKSTTRKPTATTTTTQKPQKRITASTSTERPLQKISTSTQNRPLTTNTPTATQSSTVKITKPITTSTESFVTVTYVETTISPRPKPKPTSQIVKVPSTDLSHLIENDVKPSSSTITFTSKRPVTNAPLTKPSPITTTLAGTRPTLTAKPQKQKPTVSSTTEQTVITTQPPGLVTWTNIAENTLHDGEEFTDKPPEWILIPSVLPSASSPSLPQSSTLIPSSSSSVRPMSSTIVSQAPVKNATISSTQLVTGQVTLASKPMPKPTTQQAPITTRFPSRKPTQSSTTPGIILSSTEKLTTKPTETGTSTSAKPIVSSTTIKFTTIPPPTTIIDDFTITTESITQFTDDFVQTTLTEFSEMKNTSYGTTISKLNTTHIEMSTLGTTTPLMTTTTTTSAATPPKFSSTISLPSPSTAGPIKVTTYKPIEAPKINVTYTTVELLTPSSTTVKRPPKPASTTTALPLTTKIPSTKKPVISITTPAPSTTSKAETLSTESSTSLPITTTPFSEFSPAMDNVTSEAIEQFTTESISSTTSISQMLEGIEYRQVCGKRMYPEPRIVGGSKASFGRWPWQISLRQWRTSTYLHKCGAALLNENWAITAAHCVDNVPPSDLLLRLGEYDLAEEEEPFVYQERRVQIVASHPQFDPRTFEYDLALLRFYEPVVFQPNIIPVCVPESDENFIGRTAFVTGWGRLYEDGPLPSVLQEVSVPVINNTLCEGMYRNAGYIEHIPHIFICAGWRKGGYDSCEGDSGGPMVIQRDDKRFLLAGVISWGIGCAEPNQPGVYTRISEFREWINQILQF